jgi:hypothetical protein
MRNRHHLTQAALLFAFAAHVYAADDSSITGAIADSSGKPVSKATVTIQDASGKAVGAVQTDTKGHFILDHVNPGTYAIVVTAPGFASGSSIATTTPGKESSVSIALAKSDALDVQVNAQRLNRAQRPVARNGQQRLSLQPERHQRSASRPGHRA